MTRLTAGRTRSVSRAVPAVALALTFVAAARTAAFSLVHAEGRGSATRVRDPAAEGGQQGGVGLRLAEHRAMASRALSRVAEATASGWTPASGR